MKLRIGTKELNNALAIATRALSSRTTNPIFEGILLEAEDEALKITCSDERVTIITRVDAAVDERGSGVIPGRSFSELMRRMPEGDIDIEMNEKHMFRVKSAHQSAQARFSGQDASLFPLPPVDTGMNSVRMAQKQLKDMINRTEFAIAVDDMREVLTGASLKIKDGRAVMVGLDGYRMAMSEYQLFGEDAEMDIIIPGRAVSDIGRLLNDDEESFCRLSGDKSRFCLTYNKTVMFVSLIEGEYINYERLLPKSFSTTVTCEVDALRACIDRAALIARESANNLVRFDFRDGVMFVDSNSETNDIHEEIPAEKTGDDLKITFNIKYIQDVLKGMDAERIRMCFNSPINPSIMKPDEEASYQHLVLPVRTQS